MNLDRKYSVESSNSYSLSEKSAALEADAAFYKYRMRGWRVKASLYCPSEYYLETFMIQHKIETKQDGENKKKKKARTKKQEEEVREEEHDRKRQKKSIHVQTEGEGNMFSLQQRNAVALPGWPKAK